MCATDVELRDEFEYWLASMDDALDNLFRDVPIDIRKQLDYSPPSLDILERWILATYPDTESMLLPEQTSRLNDIACYIGETFRKTAGGGWDIQFDEPDDVYHGLPVVLRAREGGTPECPLSVATASADRRTGIFIRTVFENWI